MSISDRLDQIEARAQAATPADAETSLSMDGFNMHEDYPEYGQGQLINAYMLGYDEGSTDKGALVAALRAVLAECEDREEVPEDSGSGADAARVIRRMIAAALGEES